jgi:hypothetical protein
VNKIGKAVIKGDADDCIDWKGAAALLILSN